MSATQSKYYVAQASHPTRTCIVFAETPSTVTVIEISDASEHVVSNYRRMEFLKTFKPLYAYPVALAATKYLTSFLPCSQQATLALRRLIMETAKIIVVTLTAEFVGRFADTTTAAQHSGDNDVVIQCAEDFEQFDKATLTACLIANSVEVSKGSKKDELSESLLACYMNKEVKTKGRLAKVKAPKKDAVDRAPSLKSILRIRIEAHEHVSLDKLAEELGKSPATARTQLQALKSDKVAPLDVVSGIINGERFYMSSAAAALCTFDEKTIVTRAGKSGEPRAPKTDGPVYKVHTFLDANPAMPRKDAIAALVLDGVNKATATTQYGAWSAKNPELVAGKAAAVAAEKVVAKEAADAEKAVKAAEKAAAKLAADEAKATAKAEADAAKEAAKLAA